MRLFSAQASASALYPRYRSIRRIIPDVLKSAHARLYEIQDRLDDLTGVCPTVFMWMQKEYDKLLAEFRLRAVMIWMLSG